MNLREFEKWALAQGSVANPEPDCGFKGQCVSLVQQYLYNVCGIKFKARGNAKDWANNIIEGWDKLSATTQLKAGDILVYTSGEYGHIVIVDADLQCLEQNRKYDGKITVSAVRKGYSCVLRSRQAINTGNEIPESNITYTVQTGDTLSGIAQKYKTTVNSLIEANKNKYPKIAETNGNYIQIGWVLNIANNTTNNQTSNTIFKVNANSGLWLLDINGKKIKAYAKGTEAEYLENEKGYTKYGYIYFKVRVLCDNNVGYMAKAYLI